MTANAMRESAAALNLEYHGDAANLNRNIDSLLYRFSNNALKDTCARVAVDPIRKLGENDRIIGALNNCQNYGLPAIYIAGIAAAAALMLEKSFSGKGNLPKLAEVTGLSAESDAYKMIMTFGTTCASAIARGKDPVASLRRTAMKYAGDIKIL
jgi:mannitol-1-phosphate 5-dehydrogenase